MKNVLVAISFLVGATAFAGTSPIDLIAHNYEVKSAVASFEANRGQKCEAIDKSNVVISTDGAVRVRISCNQYDNNGEPQANVHFITMNGHLYDSFFELSSVAIVGVE